MLLGDVLSAEVIVAIAVILLIGTIIPGVRLYWPRRSDPVSRSDLGVALMGGALIAFAVLVLQLMIQSRAEDESRQRQELADRESLLLVLGQSPNLSGLDLHEEDLSEAYLSQKVLRGADLTGAEMKKVRLEGADLLDADLEGADLTEARLDRADLRYADLSGATLVGASLSGAKLGAASLVDAKLSGADLSDALVQADLRRADLRGANLVGARFARANLAKADLRGADLDFADLRGANLKGAKLRGPESDGTGDAKLDSPKDLSFVRYDGGTKWPHDFDWDGEPPPVCEAADCWLEPKTQLELVEDRQTELLQMRQGLEQAARDDDRLPGWWVDERLKTINAHAPDDRARFMISMHDALGRTAKSFADGVIASRRKPIPGVKVVPATDTYAETFHRRDEESERDACYVAVYFVRGRRAFRLWGWAPREVFSQFELDFEELFSTTGVSGDLFPETGSGEDGCT